MGTGEPTIDPSITILVSLSDHLINFIICQFLANGCHNVTELRSGDETVVVSVEDLCRKSLSLEIFQPQGCGVNMHQGGTLNASLISSSESVSFIFRAIIVRNSAKHQRLCQNILVLAHTREINSAIVISVDFVDHVLKLRFRRILTKRSHDSSQLLSSDLSYSYPSARGL